MILAVAAMMMMGSCSQQRRWTHDQRKAVREMLKDYRRMVYLDDLNDAEYAIFSDSVTNNLENDYPVYTSFVEMPGANDTVQVYVVSTIVEALDTDKSNMRHIFPYPYLVGAGVLPSGLDRKQQNAFYDCLADKVNTAYPSTDAFFNAILADTTVTSPMMQLETQCANDLFGWTVVITEQTLTPAQAAAKNQATTQPVVQTSAVPAATAQPAVQTSAAPAATAKPACN